MVLVIGKICVEIVSVVLYCFIINEYNYIVLYKCVGVCGDLEGWYKYYCMCDFFKIVFMEMCVILKCLFGKLIIVLLS